MKRYVIKVGSSSVTNDEVGLNDVVINNLARQISSLSRDGAEVALVSSGAVAAGRYVLVAGEQDLIHKQVAASFGQVELTLAWAQAFRIHNILLSQFLLTGNTLEYPKHTLLGALKQGIPLINANDTVNDKEMKQYELAADNDQLSGFVVREIDANKLILLTDVDGVKDQAGNVISEITSAEMIDKIVFSAKSKKGTGGMKSKLDIAWQAATEGRTAWIANANLENVILKIASGEPIGTKVFKP